MTNHDEDSFLPKLKPPRSTRSASPRFISRVIKAASQSGPVARGQVSPGRAREGGKLGRGFVQARLARYRRGATSRRVTVKMRLVVLARAGRRSTATHLKYLEREGVTPDGKRGHAYGQIYMRLTSRSSNAAGRATGISSGSSSQPKTEGAKDLKSYTRDLTAQMEQDLGTRLEWVAVDHWDTGHPHSHVVLRG